MKTLILVAALILGGASQTTRSVRDGIYSDAQQKRGAAVFAANCALCHGQDLSGGEIAPALFGGNFMSNWNGLTVGDLSERIRNSMPPDNPDKLNQQQRVDLIATILRANDFPAGEKDLDTRVEVLKLIKIEPK